jgi:hypothetical protein
MLGGPIMIPSDNNDDHCDILGEVAALVRPGGLARETGQDALQRAAPRLR